MPPARNRGSITLEIIIAFAVFSLVLTSIILMQGGDRGALIRESDELSLARGALADAQYDDYLSVESTTTQAKRNGFTYGLAETARDLTPCVKSVEVAATTSVDSVSLSGWVADSTRMRALGGDCETRAASGAWKQASVGVAKSTSGASGTAIDVLQGFAYIGLSAPPYLAIIDTDSGEFVSFQNGFTLPAAPNDLDAISIRGHRYAFLALNATTSQLAVVDVTDTANPTLLASLSLAGVNGLGANPQAYQVLYDDGRAYVASRYIAGPQPELHIFDVSDPAAPREIGSANIETTVNGMAMRDDPRSGSLHRYLFAATTHDQKELAVYDATNPAAVPPTPVAAVDFGSDTSGTSGTSLELVGNTLYFGRASNTGGPELYLYDVAGIPDSAPALIGSGEVGSKDVSGIAVSGALVFLTATLDAASTRPLEVWSVADPAHPARLLQIPIAGLAPGGLDVSGDRLFATGSTLFEALNSD